MSAGQTLSSKDSHTRLFEHGQEDPGQGQEERVADQDAYDTHQYHQQPRQYRRNDHLPHSGQLPQQQQQQEQVPPRSVLGALSISLYQSLSFSRSPSFERTRYIASTCTFIAIIYLRTLHCLFFGTGALSCAVLAKCLKHTIRQPRPERPEETVDAGQDNTETYMDMSTTTTTTTTVDNAVITTGETSGPTGGASSSSSSSSSSAYISTATTRTTTTIPSKETTGHYHHHHHHHHHPSSSYLLDDPIARTPSPTLTLAPSTVLQREEVAATNQAQANRKPTIAATTANSTEQRQQQQPEQRQRRRRQQQQQQFRRKYRLRVDYGMPSSHAQLVAFFVTYISLQLILMEPEGSPGQWFLILLLELYAWSVVWSRIRLGRHTVSQVLVGAAIGTAYGLIWFAIWSWKVERMIQHWQWMDRYGVIQVRKIWRQLEMDDAVAVGGVGGRRIYHLHDDQAPPFAMPLRGPFLRI
ncbi:hypothetical protein BG004_004960 [Podila humilis]|nr:hypothetical protein BG004_004960 [Podila humilis]